MSDSVLIRLGEVCKNASRRFSPPEDGKVWFVNTGDVEKGRFTHNNLSDWDGLPGQAKKAIVPGDILYSEIRPGNGRYAFVDRNYPNAVVSTKFMVIEADDNILPKYLYHVITSPEIQSAMKLIAESRSGTFPQITFDSIAHLQFTLPPKSNQQEVSSLLDGIEKRIRNNQKMNQTLEEIAKAIFKSWFVDFDPVRAKAEGRPRGLPPEISDLFPDELVDSEIGEIPKGWGLSTPHDLVSTISDTYPLKTVDNVIFLNTGDIEDGRFLHNNFSPANELPGQAKKSIKRGDILFSEIRPKNKRFALVRFESDEYVVSTKLMVLRTQNNVRPELPYFLLTRTETINQLQHIAENRSGTFPQITFEQLKEIKICSPKNYSDPMNPLGYFTEKVLVPFYSRIDLVIRENKVLSELRDTLLPKLISGELRIPDAEKFLEEAGI